MKLLKALAILPLALLLSQCEQKPSGPSPYAFDVTLDITPEAAEVMKARNSHFVVAALYFGRAKPEARARANAQGRIKLGYEQIGLGQGATRLHLPVETFDEALLADINGEPQVMINVFSAGDVGARDDLARCKTFTGYLKTVKTQPPVLSCDINRP